MPTHTTRSRISPTLRLEEVEARLAPARLDFLDGQFIRAQGHVSSDIPDSKGAIVHQENDQVQAVASEEFGQHSSFQDLAAVGRVQGINSRVLFKANGEARTDLYGAGHTGVPLTLAVSPRLVFNTGTTKGVYAGNSLFGTTGVSDAAGAEGTPIRVRVVSSDPAEPVGTPVRVTLSALYDGGPLPAIDGLSGGLQYKATYDIGLGPVTLISGDEKSSGANTFGFNSRVGDEFGLGVRVAAHVSYNFDGHPMSFGDGGPPQFSFGAVADALPAPRGQLVVSPTALDFGDVTQTRSADREFTVTNAGPAGSRLRITFGDPGSPFRVASVNGDPALREVELAGGQSATVAVRFAPSSSSEFGRRDATLVVYAADLNRDRGEVPASAGVALSGLMAPVPTNLHMAGFSGTPRDPGDLPVKMRFYSSSSQITDLFTSFWPNGSARTSNVVIRELVGIKDMNAGAGLNTSVLPGQDPRLSIPLPPPWTDKAFPNQPGGSTNMPTWPKITSFFGEAERGDIPVDLVAQTAVFKDGHGLAGGFDPNHPTGLAELSPGSHSYTVLQKYQYRVPWLNGGDWIDFDPKQFFEITREVFSDGSDAAGNPIWYYRTRKIEYQNGVPVPGGILENTAKLGTAVGLTLNRTVAAGPGPGGTPTVTLYPPAAVAPITVRAFDTPSPGGVRTAAGDFNGDGTDDAVVATGPGVATRVRILDGRTQQELFAVTPFEESFVGGLYVSTGDLTGDGVPDLVVTPDEGGGPRVRVFDGHTGEPVLDFYGIEDLDFRGGARAAVADVTGDGVPDLIVAAGFGGGPRISAWDGASRQGNALAHHPFGDFFMFEQTLRNGVYIAGGDLDGDGVAEVIAGGGPGGGPRVFALSGRHLMDGQQVVRANFFAGDPAARDGVRIAVKNLDGDERADLITSSGGRVSRYLGVAIDPTGAATPESVLDLGALNGVFVG